MHLDAFTKVSDIPRDTRVVGKYLLHRARILCTGNTDPLSNTPHNPFPTRVLVIPQDISSNSLSIREFGPTMKGQYIALSHR